jgi:hypothetical protein
VIPKSGRLLRMLVRSSGVGRVSEAKRAEQSSPCPIDLLFCAGV